MGWLMGGWLRGIAVGGATGTLGAILISGPPAGRKQDSPTILVGRRRQNGQKSCVAANHPARMAGLYRPDWAIYGG
jgi:hypothetical protein